MAVKMRHRVIMRIEISQHARNTLADFGDRLGLTQVSVLSRLMTWIDEQPDDIRNSILFTDQTDHAETARKILKSMLNPSGARA